MGRGQGFLSACCLASFPCRWLPLCWQRSSFILVPGSHQCFLLACPSLSSEAVPEVTVELDLQQVVHVGIAHVFNTSTLLNWIWSTDFDWFMALQLIEADIRARVVIFFHKHTTCSLYKEIAINYFIISTFSTLDFSSSLLFSRSAHWTYNWVRYLFHACKITNVQS